LSQFLDKANHSGVDAVVSSLGLTSMDHATRKSIYDQVRECLRPSGVLTQYQYLTSQASCKLSRSDFDEERFLKSYFHTVTTKWVYINFPPACVFTCRKA
jgi:phospholipid N-methyltransferase